MLIIWFNFVLHFLYFQDFYFYCQPYWIHHLEFFNFYIKIVINIEKKTIFWKVFNKVALFQVLMVLEAVNYNF